MGSKKKERISFDDFYQEIFQSRWPSIRQALSQEPHYHEIPPVDSRDGSRVSYFLDEASYRTALLLEPQPEDLVLDMCAAPGGKSLSLLHAFPSIQLTSNEWSSARRARLHRVLQDHLGPDYRRRVKVTGFDANIWYRHEREKYDRILLDVPCSSERHLLSSPKHLRQWSPTRSKRLALQAFGMLASALEVVRVGGIIVYSTCALCPEENDGVIEKLYRKRPGRFELLPAVLPFGEKTGYGWQVIPDTAEGRGPIYCARIKRIAEHGENTEEENIWR